MGQLEAPDKMRTVRRDLARVEDRAAAEGRTNPRHG
jgi:ribosomal protein L29